MTEPTPIRSDLNTDQPEAPPRRQPGALVSVILEGYPEPLEVRVTNRERIAYEKTAARHSEWPPGERAQSFVMTFVTFVAAKRAGHPAATTFEAWQEIVLDWDEVDAAADPTQ
jgi:hypothetical protein